MPHYSVILDEVSSKIIPSEESSMTFKQAVQHVLEYVSDAGYDLQQAIFEDILQDGEDAFLAGKNSITLV